VAVIIDTDVVSFLLKKDTRAELYRPHIFGKSDAHKYGNPIDTADAWVAAVALLFDIPLVTNNRRHFENVGNLKIISES
jgi:predicted nucleic acid-binding protein